MGMHLIHRRSLQATNYKKHRVLVIRQRNELDIHIVYRKQYKLNLRKGSGKFGWKVNETLLFWVVQQKFSRSN